MCSIGTTAHIPHCIYITCHSCACPFSRIVTFNVFLLCMHMSIHIQTCLYIYSMCCMISSPQSFDPVMHFCLMQLQNRCGNEDVKHAEDLFPVTHMILTASVSVSSEFTGQCALVWFKTFLVSELRTSVTSFQYDLKPDVPKCEGRKLFFDTHAVVRLLEENGLTSLFLLHTFSWCHMLDCAHPFVFLLPLFWLSTGFTTQQAEVFVKVLLKMTHSNMDVIYNDMVTKAQQVRLCTDAISTFIVT